MKTQGKILLAASLVLLAAAVFFAGIVMISRRGGTAANAALPTETLKIGGATVTAEIAATPDGQRQGLSGRVALAPDAGMLFPIDPPGRPGFWMKDMNFALDFVYLRDGRVVEIKENVAPSLAPVPFYPKQAVDAVLEVNAGWVAGHGIAAGDTAF